MGFRVSLLVLVLPLATALVGSAIADDSIERIFSSATHTDEHGSSAASSLVGPTPYPAPGPVIVPNVEPAAQAKEDVAPKPPLSDLTKSQPEIPAPDAKMPDTCPAKQDPIPSVIPFDVNLSPGPAPPTIQVPEDPCLPGLYKDWQEMSTDSQERGTRNSYSYCRIIIDRSSFQLVIEGVRRDGTADEIYRTHVGLGDVNSPTPEGNFVINHIYCYPDVVYFDASGKKVPGLYNGFFAPLLLCEDRKHCRRYHDLGIHGFRGSAARRHNVAVASVATYGAISAGCIRVPDPCRLKSELIRLVGIGPVKQNDRGTYHWLGKPVEVAITGYYPGTEDQTTLVSIFEQSLEQVHGGLKDLLGMFGR